jgi:hypothetical protein
MEHCPVMPNVEPPEILKRDHITHDPVDLVGAVFQPTLGDVERGLRDVEDRDLLKLQAEKMIDEG